jgi:hypothetical protein
MIHSSIYRRELAITCECGGVENFEAQSSRVHYATVQG